MLRTRTRTWLDGTMVARPDLGHGRFLKLNANRVPGLRPGQLSKPGFLGWVCRPEPPRQTAPSCPQHSLGVVPRDGQDDCPHWRPADHGVGTQANVLCVCMGLSGKWKNARRLCRQGSHQPWEGQELCAGQGWGTEGCRGRPAREARGWAGWCNSFFCQEQQWLLVWPVPSPWQVRAPVLLLEPLEARPLSFPGPSSHSVLTASFKLWQAMATWT